MNLKSSILKLLLIPLVLSAWGFSWPIMKLSLQALPPLWLGVFRLGIGCLVLFAILIFSGRKLVPQRRDLPFLFSVGLGQMGVFTLLIIIGLTHVSAGRSAILAYTTPLWVAPIAIGFFKEPLNKFTLLGIALGILGVLCLFNPLTFNWSDHSALLGNGLLLMAAIIWALVIVHVRYGRHYSSPLELAPWQMLLATFFMILAATIFEPRPAISWSWPLVGQLSYLGPIATAFAYWGIIDLNRRLPAVTISLLLLAVPMIGLFSSALILGEKMTMNTGIAMLFILAGLCSVALAKRACTPS